MMIEITLMILTIIRIIIFIVFIIIYIVLIGTWVGLASAKPTTASWTLPPTRVRGNDVGKC